MRKELLIFLFSGIFITSLLYGSVSLAVVTPPDLPYLILQDPENDEKNVSLTPTLQWKFEIDLDEEYLPNNWLNTNQSCRVIFSWKVAEGTRSTADFNNPIQSGDTEEYSVTISALQKNHTYSWNVEAVRYCPDPDDLDPPSGLYKYEILNERLDKESSVETFSFSTGELIAPEPYSPANNSYDAFVDTKITWNYPGSLADSYQWKVINVCTGKEKQDEVGDQRWAKPSFEKGEVYTWEVQACMSGDVCTGWPSELSPPKQPFRFMVQLPTSLDEPRMREPSKGDIDNPTSVTTYAPTFKWDKVAGAELYYLKIRGHGVQTIIIDVNKENPIQGISKESFFCKPYYRDLKLEEGERYSWQITACQKDEVVGTGANLTKNCVDSDTWWFRVGSDAPPVVDDPGDADDPGGVDDPGDADDPSDGEPAPVADHVEECIKYIQGACDTGRVDCSTEDGILDVISYNINTICKYYKDDDRKFSYREKQQVLNSLFYLFPESSDYEDVGKKYNTGGSMGSIGFSCGEEEPCEDGVVCIQNPLCASSFTDLIDSIINFVFWVGMALAPVMLIIGGFWIVTAAGSPERLKTGKRIILYTLIGLSVVLLASGLIKVLQSILGYEV